MNLHINPKPVLTFYCLNALYRYRNVHILIESVIIFRENTLLPPPPGDAHASVVYICSITRKHMEIEVGKLALHHV